MAGFTDFFKRKPGEDRYRTVLESMPAMVWTLAADGRCDYLSPQWRAYTGVSADVQLSSGFAAQVHPDDFENVRDLRLAAVRAGVGYEAESRIRSAAGEYRWFRIVGIPVRDLSGNVTKWVGTGTDIENLKGTEAALRASEASFRQLADAMPHLVWTATREGNLDYYNRRWYEYTGSTFSQSKDWGWPAVVHPGDLARCLARWTNSIATGELYEVEYRIKRASDGVYRWHLGRALPVLDGNGAVIRWFGTCTDIEEHKQAQASITTLNEALEKQVEERTEELRVSEKRSRLLIENIREHAILMLSPGGIVITWNAGAERIKGYTANQILGRHYSSFFTPEDIAAGHPERALRTATENGHFEEAGWRIRRDGKRFWAEVVLTCLRDPNGVLLGFSKITKDSTARKVADDAIRESEDRFRIMADGCPTGMWVTDAEGALQFINRAYRDFCGEGSTPVAGQKWQFTVHPDDAQAHRECFERAVREHSSFRAEARVRNTGGEWRWASWHGEPRMSGGAYQGHVGLTADITERRRNEILLRHSADRQILATRAGAVGIWDWDVQKDAMIWDDQMFRLYGITRAEVPESYEAWQAGVHPEDRKRSEEEIRLALQGEKDFNTEFRVVWPDKMVHSIRALGEVQRDSSSMPTHMVGTNWDITAQKQAADELLEMNRQLEETTIRANELALAADRANQAKSDFLARMSHEIRTPMNLIMGMNALLLDGPLTEKQRQHAGISFRNVKRLLRLINGILDLSKVEAGAITLEAVPFDLEDVMRECAATMAASVEQKCLRLEISIDPSTWLYWNGDVERLDQVLMNLIGNAVKFTAKGKIEVKVRPEPGEGLRFEVTDSGCGVPADKAKMIFEPFQQAERYLNRSYEGTGLGLAISETLVDMMSGRLWLEETAEPGSTFVFTAFFPKITAEEAGGKTSAAIAARVEPSFQAGTRILLVEDNEENVILTRAYLEGHALSVHYAINGLQALQKRQNAEYDLILMDIQMPVMDGYTSTREIRAWEQANRKRRVPIVALTAHALTGASTESVEAGCEGHLTKPVDRSDLLKAIARFASRHAPPAVSIPEAISARRPAFLANRRLDAGKMRAAMTVRDFGTIQSIGHNCKGIGTGYGFPEISSAGSAIEIAARAKDLAALETCIREFERCVPADGLVK